MKKYKIFDKHTILTLSSISAMFIIYNIFGMIYIRAIDVHHEYTAIKYQAGDIEMKAELVPVVIEGTFKRKFWGLNRHNEFDGNIYIDGELAYRHIGESFSTSLYIFGDDNMSGIMTKDIKGDLFITDSMKKLAILIFDGNTLIPNSASIIAGPAENREQAVDLTNNLIKYSYGIHNSIK